MVLAYAFILAIFQNVPQTSWYKLAISYETYRADAIACAKQGYFRDMSNDLPAKQFIRGFQTADDQLNKNGDGPRIEDWMDSVRRTQPDDKKRQLPRVPVGDVEACLTAKNYWRFTLTRSEEKALRKLPWGSEQRHRFVYALSMDRAGRDTPARTDR